MLSRFVLELRDQDPAQCKSPAMETDCDSSLTQTEPSSNVCLWQVLDVPFDENPAGIGWEQAHGSIQQGGKLAPFQLQLDVDVVQRHLRWVEERVYPGSFAASLPSPSQADVPGNSKEPLDAASGVSQVLFVPPGLE
jgi:hypothetical protein